MSIPVETKQSLVDYARRAAAARLVLGSEGNLSVRDPEAGVVAITPHELEYDVMGPEDIVVVDLDGAVVEGRREPSEETPVHLAVYRERGDVHALVHTEPVFANVFGVLGQPIEPVLVSLLALCGGPVPVMPFRRSGSREFGEETVRAMGGGNAVVWAHHGLLTAGATLRDAFRCTVAVERSAEVLAAALRVGGAPVPLSVEQLTP